MLAFFTPSPVKRLGEEISNGFTAGKGMEGAGEADLRIEGEDPKEERRLRETGGGSIGKGTVIGVPGVDGPGEEAGIELLVVDCTRFPMSGGAGLFDDIRLAGRSILWNFPWEVNVNCPSFVFSV